MTTSTVQVKTHWIIVKATGYVTNPAYRKANTAKPDQARKFDSKDLAQKFIDHQADTYRNRYIMKSSGSMFGGDDAQTDLHNMHLWQQARIAELITTVSHEVIMP